MPGSTVLHLVYSVLATQSDDSARDPVYQARIREIGTAGEGGPGGALEEAVRQPDLTVESVQESGGVPGASGPNQTFLSMPLRHNGQEHQQRLYDPRVSGAFSGALSRPLELCRVYLRAKQASIVLVHPRVTSARFRSTRATSQWIRCWGAGACQCSSRLSSRTRARLSLKAGLEWGMYCDQGSGRRMRGL